jgi:hypothetical protein
MAAWVIIKDSDLDDYLLAAQMNALRSAALRPGQGNPFVRVMEDRAKYIQNRISNRIQISATPFAVPPELKTQACWLIIEAMAGRLAVAVKLEDGQKTQIEDAKRDLDRAAKGELFISDPDDPVSPSVQTGGGISVVSSRTNTVTGKTMTGL